MSDAKSEEKVVWYYSDSKESEHQQFILQVGAAVERVASFRRADTASRSDFVFHFHTGVNGLERRDQFVPYPECKMHIHVIRTETPLNADPWFATVMPVMISSQNATIFEWRKGSHPNLDQIKACLKTAILKLQSLQGLPKALSDVSQAMVASGSHNAIGLARRMTTPTKLYEIDVAVPYILLFKGAGKKDTWKDVVNDLNKRTPTPKPAQVVSVDDAKRVTRSSDYNHNMHLLVCNAGDHDSLVPHHNDFLYVVYFVKDQLGALYDKWKRSVNNRLIVRYASELSDDADAVYNRVLLILKQAEVQAMWPQINQQSAGSLNATEALDKVNTLMKQVRSTNEGFIKSNESYKS